MLVELRPQGGALLTVYYAKNWKAQIGQDPVVAGRQAIYSAGVLSFFCENCILFCQVHLLGVSIQHVKDGPSEQGRRISNMLRSAAPRLDKYIVVFVLVNG